MKKNLLSFKIYKLIVIFLLFYCNMQYAQSVTPSGSNPTSAEVGIANYFTFYANMPADATITKWVFTSDTDVDIYGNPSGFIQNSNSSSYTATTSASLFTVLVAWGNNCSGSKTVKLKATISYIQGGNSYSTYAEQTVTLYKIPCSISINGASSSPNCCATALTYTVSDTGDADRFQWTISGNGSQVYSGQNTKTLTITNPGTDNFTLTFKAWRYTGHPGYVRTITKTVTRTDLSASMSLPLYGGNPQTFICKGGDINVTLNTNSGGCSSPSIMWNAPNCTVTSLGSNQYNITPLSSVVVGSNVNISATVSVGTCSITIPSVSLKVYDSQAPTLPNGYLSYTYDGDFCTADILEMHFNDYNFVNGVSVVTPDFMPGTGDEIHYKPNVKKNFTVCNTNLCTNATACKTYSIYPPAPCADPYAKQSDNSISIYPNPATENINIQNTNNESGTFYIYNNNGLLMISGDISAKQKVNINTSKLKEGQYTVYFKSANAESSKQLIIKK